jgi:hypothetical protein
VALLDAIFWNKKIPGLIEYTLFYKKPMFKITFVHYTRNVFTPYVEAQQQELWKLLAEDQALDGNKNFFPH